MAQSPILRFNEKYYLQFQLLYRHFPLKVRPPFHLIPSSEAYAKATLSGLGWGLNPTALVQKELESGQLINLRPDAPLDVPLYWQVSRLHRELLAPLTRRICQTTIQSLPQ